MAAGRLPLLHALRCAADLAAGLRDLHAVKALHGSVTPVFVAIEAGRAVLMNAPGSAATASEEGDIRSFGAVLYEMLVGRKPGTEAFAPLTVRSPYTGPWTEVYQSALAIAAKCMAASAGALPHLQNVTTELRLLLLIANRAPARQGRPGERAAADAHAHPKPSPDDQLEDEEEWDEEDEDWDDLTDQFCPCCGTQDVHWSGLRSPLERFLGRLGVPFYRCHRCFHRYMVMLGIRVTMINPL